MSGEGAVTSRSHLRPSLPLPASAEPLPASPELGPTPPPPAGYVGLGRPPQPRPARGQQRDKDRRGGIYLMAIDGFILNICRDSYKHPYIFFLNYTVCQS